ncbi:hypothetical protein [Streptomyces sp. 6N106]|uniref:hypothetical protein n=1 Tax=Streptomyces sp. 6N106 TaxID=3457418 RepID=UPI003FD5FC80
MLSELMTNAVRHAQVPGRAMESEIRSSRCTSLLCGTKKPPPNFPGGGFELLWT